MPAGSSTASAAAPSCVTPRPTGTSVGEGSAAKKIPLPTARAAVGTEAPRKRPPATGQRFSARTSLPHHASGPTQAAPAPEARVGPRAEGEDGDEEEQGGGSSQTFHRPAAASQPTTWPSWPFSSARAARRRRRTRTPTASGPSHISAPDGSPPASSPPAIRTLRPTWVAMGVESEASKCLPNAMALLPRVPPPPKRRRT
mmetsp:Transcript_9300/g.28706  ORF Transcript_9300/g.28706 Transcript_9300/m.28706 type:complete len:200 (-) Transcript_9300:14-613(-)